MSERWKAAEDLYLRGRPGKAFDLAVSAFPSEESDWLTLAAKLPDLIKACPAENFDERRRAEVERIRPAVFDSAFTLPEPKHLVGRVPFPVVGGDSRYCDIHVSMVAGEVDRIPADLAEDSRAAVESALNAARRHCATAQRFEVLVLSENLKVEGRSLGLATALAAVSRVSDSPVSSRWSATGHVASNGAVEAVGHIDDKLALATEERPAGLLLVPESQAPNSDLVRGVATLAAAVDWVFAPDLEAAEKAYATRLAEQTNHLDVQRLAIGGVDRELLVPRPLTGVHVWPEASREDWVLLARKIEAAGDDSKELRQKYEDLTSETYQRGLVARRDISTFRTSSPRLVVCGDLGLGKSTLLRRFAYEAALAHETGEPLPLLLDATGFSPADGDSGLAAFVRHQSEGRGALPVELLAIDTRLAQGRVVLFVDGLNELLDPSAREMFLKALGRYLTAHSSAEMVLATRAWAYEVPLSVEPPVVHLQPFSPAQAEKYWAVNHPGRGDLRSVLRLMPRGHDGESPLVNPMLLAMAGHLSARELTGVRHRVQLFERFVRKLIARVEDSEARVDERLALWGNAFLLAREAGAGAASRPRWTKWLVEAGVVAEKAATEFDFAVKSVGLLVKGTDDRFAPFHESVGEFLAAVWLTREPLAEFASRLGELPRDPAFREIAQQAVARAVLTLEEGRAAEDAFRALLGVSHPLDVAWALSLAVAAREERLPFSLAFEDELLGRLAAHTRAYPDVEAARAFAELAERLLRQDDARTRIRGPLLDELLRLVEARHPVRESARVEALRLISLAASSNPRARDLCSQQYAAGRTGDAEGVVAVGLLESDTVPLEKLVSGLGRALEEGRWYDRVDRLRGRIGLALRRPLRSVADLQRLRDTADEKTTHTIELLTAMAAPDDTEALRALFARHNANSSDAARGVVAHVVAHSASALRCLLQEPFQHWFTDALAEVDAHLLRTVVLPWLLDAPREVKTEVSRGWQASARSDAVSSVVSTLCHLAGTGDATTALSAVEILHNWQRERPDYQQVSAAVLAGVERLVALVDESQAVRLWNLVAWRQGDLRRAFLERFLGSPEVLDALDRYEWTADELSLFDTRLTRAIEEADHRLVWSLTRIRHRVSEVGRQALRWLVDTAPEELADEAAWRLAGLDLLDLELARRLTRSPGAAAPSRRYGEFAALATFVRQQALRDPEIARNLIDMDVSSSDRSWLQHELLPEMIRADETLFELVLDAALDPNPARAEAGARLVCRLVDKSDALKEQTERRIETSGAWHLMLGNVGGALYRRPFREQALRRLMEDLEATCGGMPCALEAACELAHGAALEPGLERILRRYLPAENRAVALKAVLALVDAGRDGDAIHEALRRVLEGTPRQAIVAAMLLHSMEVAGEDVVRRLVELQSAEDELSLLDGRWQRATVALSRRRQREGIDEHSLFVTETKPEGRDALRPHFSNVGTVGQAAVSLLVEMERVEVVPMLLSWLESGKWQYEAKQFLDFLGQGAHPQFVAWRLKRIGQPGSSSLRAFDALVQVIPEDPALLDAMWAHFDKDVSVLQDWVDRLVERVKASPLWLNWIDARVAALPAEVAGYRSALLLSNVVVSPTLASLDVASWPHQWTVLKYRLPRLDSSVSMDPVVGQAWLDFLDSGDAWGRFVVASAFLLEFDANLIPENVREKALEVLRRGAKDAEPEVRAESISSLARLGYEDEAAAAGRAFLQDGDHSAVAIDYRTIEALRLLAAGRERELAVRWLEQVLTLEPPPGGYLWPQTVGGLMAAGEAPVAVGAALNRWLSSNDVGSHVFEGLFEHAKILASQGHLDLRPEYFLRRELEALLLGASWAERRLYRRAHELRDPIRWLHLSRETPADRANALVRLLPELGFDLVSLARVLLTAVGASQDQVRAHEHDITAGMFSDEARALALGWVARWPEDGPVEELARAWLWRRLAAA